MGGRKKAEGDTVSLAKQKLQADVSALTNLFETVITKNFNIELPQIDKTITTSEARAKLTDSKLYKKFMKRPFGESERLFFISNVYKFMETVNSLNSIFFDDLSKEDQEANRANAEFAFDLFDEMLLFLGDVKFDDFPKSQVALLTLYALASIDEENIDSVCDAFSSKIPIYKHKLFRRNYSARYNLLSNEDLATRDQFLNLFDFKELISTVIFSTRNIILHHLGIKDYDEAMPFPVKFFLTIVEDENIESMETTAAFIAEKFQRRNKGKGRARDSPSFSPVPQRQRDEYDAYHTAAAERLDVEAYDPTFYGPSENPFDKFALVHQHLGMDLQVVRSNRRATPFEGPADEPLNDPDTEDPLDNGILQADIVFYDQETWKDLEAKVSVKRPAGRGINAWKPREVKVLDYAMGIHQKKWAIINKLYRHQLGDRGQVALKDKARNEIKYRKKNRLPLGNFIYADDARLPETS